MPFVLKLFQNNTFISFFKVYQCMSMMTACNYKHRRASIFLLIMNHLQNSYHQQITFLSNSETISYSLRLILQQNNGSKHWYQPSEVILYPYESDLYPLPIPSRMLRICCQRMRQQRNRLHGAKGLCYDT